MKNLKLESFGVQELDAKEMQKQNGGWWQAALAAAGAVIYLYNEGHDLIKGFKEGYNGGKES
ncbi:hypothetical protein QFZ20_005126 [Flavobacterium sp. W4I14]|nr:hypothetical protein [Flavobacterium sp. W4I14]